MADALVFLGPALVTCLVIASIHVYLGMHILARDIIFVDLALAQLAALGATVGEIVGGDEHEHVADAGLSLPLLPMVFTLAGAAIFAFTRRGRRFVSQEAIVGLVYAVASALMIVLLSRAPHGAERLKDVLVGSLLLSGWTDVIRLTVVYVVLGLAHVLLAKRFIQISWHPDVAETSMSHLELWDFVFYAIFGIVITLSVQVAGVLLVFSYLIAPALITKMFGNRLLPRLLYGWAVAAVASVLGVWSSWSWDIPTGAAVVVAFGALVATAGVVRAVWRPAQFRAE